MQLKLPTCSIICRQKFFYHLKEEICYNIICAIKGHFGPVAQWIEQRFPKPCAVGSTPIWLTNYFRRSFDLRFYLFSLLVFITLLHSTWLCHSKRLSESIYFLSDSLLEGSNLISHSPFVSSSVVPSLISSKLLPIRKDCFHRRYSVMPLAYSCHLP